MISYPKQIKRLALRENAEAPAVAAQLALEMVHEIRNPLEALSNLIYLTLERADEPEVVRCHMHLAREQTATLNEISSNELGFARSSRLPKPICLVALAEAALRIHRKAIEARKIHLVKDLPSTLVAEVHGGEILQVVSNLIANTLDALPVGGRLRLRLRRRQGEVHFVVADNGQGIRTDQIAEILKPFFTTKEERGTGLGLALSKGIVERHRGKIRLRSSVRPGRSGTVFKIFLPGVLNLSPTSTLRADS
jgi:signal transduction histidine kinase